MWRSNRRGAVRSRRGTEENATRTRQSEPRDLTGMTLGKAEVRRRRNIGGDGGKQVESPEDCKDSEIPYEGPRWGRLSAPRTRMTAPQTLVDHGGQFIHELKTALNKQIKP